MRERPQRWEVTFLALVMCAGAALRLALSAFDDGIYHPDEIFQSLEQAHRVVFGYGFVPWEFEDGARHWAFPGFVAGIVALAKLVHLSGAREYILFTRGVFTAIGVATIYFTYALARAIGAKPRDAVVGAALFAFGAPFVLLGPKALSETASALPIVAGFALVFDPRSRTDAWRGRVGVLLIGLSVLFRLQNGLFCVGLVAHLAIRRERRRIVEALAILVAVACVFGLVDKLTWGGWFHSARVYLAFNLSGKPLALGHYAPEPPSFYASAWWAGLGPVAAVFVLALLAFRRAPTLLGIAVVTVLVHVFMEHKQLRFLLPVMPLLAALVGVSFTVVAERSERWGRVALVVTMVGCVMSAVRLRHMTMGDIARFAPDHDARALDHLGPLNRLTIRAAAQPDICGLLVANERAWSGGYTYLHRRIPLYALNRETAREASDPVAEAARFNYVIRYRTDAEKPGTEVAKDEPFVLVRVKDSCRDDADYSWRLGPR